MAKNLSPSEQVEASKDFRARWMKAEGNEEREARSFWIELFQQVLGVEQPTKVLDFERRVRGKRIDVFNENQRVLIEHKSRGVSLDKPEQRGYMTVAGQRVPRMVNAYQQAKWYADQLPFSIRPRWIITCNFDDMRIYDLNQVNFGDSYVSVQLKDLPEQLYLLDFLIDNRISRVEQEKEVSVEAGAIVGQLYDALSNCYLNIEDDEEEQRSLNMLITRLVFLLYAEDAGLLQEHNALYRYLERIPSSKMRSALLELFDVLDTPVQDRDPYLDEDVAAFPYVNGGLFAERTVIIPQFSDDAREILLEKASAGFNWSTISPTIFGAVFESTLNPETRRAGGMHYTSVENIHKVIDPLFLDDLNARLLEAEGHDTLIGRKRALKELKADLGKLKFLDPACGSGNFLTETYTCLRKIENRILLDLQDAQGVISIPGTDVITKIDVSINQFFGIEINDFAVAVAKTALWIAEEQMMRETQEVVFDTLQFLPLTNTPGIQVGNALRQDWNGILPAKECDYIIGNPPFSGYSNLEKPQKEDREKVFSGKGGKLDYVACWYKVASEYMEGTPIQAALVSTNSIVQGQQVRILWEPLFKAGIVINFAHKTFRWASEAVDQAHVHVVIIGFSYVERDQKTLYSYTSGEPTAKSVGHINAYLVDAPDNFISMRRKPLCDVPPMAQGFKPADGQHLLLEPEERDELLRKEPAAEKWIRPFSMGEEFINGRDRYCLWLPDITPQELQELPEVLSIVRACRDWRLQQIPTGDAYKLADRPHLLRPTSKFKDGTYIGVPKVSSERRNYIPMGFVRNGMIPGDMLYFVASDSIYVFGILMSQFHNAWMRVVAGRLKSDYRYANTIVYNNFVFPSPTPPQRKKIEDCAQSVLDARAEYTGATLADLYDPDNEFLYPDLVKAHHNLDKAVEDAYGVSFNGDEEKIVTHLFKLYAQATS